ncbi:MAG: hypothetical protein ACOX1Y_01125 [Zhaonellaceae bacterium]|nr:hypothetical protein [Clostridia bacterium]
MKSNLVDVLGLPYLIAIEKIKTSGFNIGKVTYTISPKQENETLNPRVVRQNIISGKKVDLVLANSPWVSVLSERG